MRKLVVACREKEGKKGEEEGEGKGAREVIEHIGFEFPFPPACIRSYLLTV